METRQERLKIFISFVYNGNKSALQRDIEDILNKKIASQNFQFLINKDTINDEYKDCLVQLGMNLNWYMYGQGEMFADNETGQRLKFKYEKITETINPQNVARDNIEVYRSKDDSIKTSSAGEKVIIQRIENIESMLEQLIGNKEIKSLNVPVAAGKIKQLENK
jgi:hypothetical protein